MDFNGPEHEVSISLRVYCKSDLIKAAREKARADGIEKPGTVIVDYRDALRWLIDPGSLPGVEILDSNIE